MDRPYPGVAVGGDRGRVERRVLDVVAHRDHELGTHRLDVHQRAAVVEPELAVIVIDDPIAEIHELGRGPDVELQSLEDGLDRVPGEPECPLHPRRVERARPHPLVDGDVAHPVPAERPDQVGHACPVDHVPGEEVLGHEARKLVPRPILYPGGHRHPPPLPGGPGARTARVSHIHRAATHPASW